MKSASFDKSLSIEHNDMLLHACIHVHVDVHVYMTTCIIFKNLAEGELQTSFTFNFCHPSASSNLQVIIVLLPNSVYSGLQNSCHTPVTHTPVTTTTSLPALLQVVAV